MSCKLSLYFAHTQRPCMNNPAVNSTVQALLAIILKLSQPKQQQQQLDQEDEPQQQQQQLEAFLRAQPVSTSIPFIAWLADMEAAATGAQPLRCDTATAYSPCQPCLSLPCHFHWDLMSSSTCGGAHLQVPHVSCQLCFILPCYIHQFRVIHYVGMWWCSPAGASKAQLVVPLASPA
jgi:hypothetical protein